MKRDELERKLMRLLGPEGVAAVVDLADLDGTDELPDWLARLVDAAETLPLPEVPPVVSQDIRDMFESGTLIEPHAAVLIRDTRVDKQLVGARGADVSQGWSLTYTSPVADVVLDVWPRPEDSYDVVGHVMGHGRSETAYRLALVGQSEARASSDRLGRFRFDNVVPGRHTLVVANRQLQLTIDVELGE